MVRNCSCGEETTQRRVPIQPTVESSHVVCHEYETPKLQRQVEPTGLESMKRRQLVFNSHPQGLKCSLKCQDDNKEPHKDANKRSAWSGSLVGFPASLCWQGCDRARSHQESLYFSLAYTGNLKKVKPL